MQTRPDSAGRARTSADLADGSADSESFLPFQGVKRGVLRKMREAGVINPAVETAGDVLIPDSPMALAGAANKGATWVGRMRGMSLEDVTRALEKRKLEDAAEMVGTAVRKTTAKDTRAQDLFDNARSARQLKEAEQLLKSGK